MGWGGSTYSSPPDPWLVVDMAPFKSTFSCSHHNPPLGRWLMAEATFFCQMANHAPPCTRTPRQIVLPLAPQVELISTSPRKDAT